MSRELVKVACITPGHVRSSAWTRRAPPVTSWKGTLLSRVNEVTAQAAKFDGGTAPNVLEHNDAATSSADVLGRVSVDVGAHVSITRPSEHGGGFAQSRR